MARLYSNENFPLPAVRELRALGHDVLTTVDANKAGLSVPDEEVLRFAQVEQRALLTLNRKHFIKLHQAQPDHAGIIVCTYDPDFTALSERIHAMIGSHTTLSGHLIRVNRPIDQPHPRDDA